MISKGENPLTDIKHRSAFSFALPIMIPMGLSFFFLGLGFGLYATSQGLPWWTAPVLASTIFAGSMEFVTIGLLMAGFDPVNAFMPDDVDEKWFYFHVSWLNYTFWVVSTFIGGLFGDLLASVDLRGIGFVLPGLFIVIFLEMLFNAKSNNIRGFGAVGAVVAVAMLLLTGKSLFMLASMGCMLVVCYIAYKWGGVQLD